LHRVDPIVGRPAIDAAVAETRTRLRGSVELTSPATTEPLVISTAELGAALRSDVRPNPPRVLLSIDPEALAPALDRVRGEIERPSRAATFEVDAHHHVTVVPSEVGVRLDSAKTAGEAWAAAARPNRRGALVVVPAEPPTMTTEQAAALGITGLVSKFTTFHSCCEARVKNIHHAADLVDGTVLAPGDTFSLNEHLGPRTLAKGFVPAPTIVHGEMEETEGGGISQFATTLFNAVLDGAYAIVQRQPHSYYFSRYPEGHEATVSFPLPDLSFKNDTNAGLLIKTEYGSTFIRILLYGDNGGRRVKRKISKRFDTTDPPLEYEANDAIAPDAAKLRYAGVVGWSVEVTRVIQYPDGGTTEQRRKVVYKPRARRVEVHPCKIPEGEPGYTGGECPEPDRPDAGADSGT
jgi:vancomycin resistance protein YoaR